MRPGIDPKVDYAFKRLFGHEPNEPLLRHFLNAILKPAPAAQITALQLLNPFSSKDAPDDKLSVVDVKARDHSGRVFHVEMQVVPDLAFRGRVLYYWAALHQQQLQSGDPYDLLRPTLSVSLTDFVMFPEVPDYCLAFEIRNRTHQLVFSPDLQLVTLELPKFTRSAEELSDPLEVWLYFMRHAAELDSDHLPAALDTPEIRRALEELNVVSTNDLERERYLARVKVQRDELSRLASARNEGLEKGREEGLEKGLEEGLERGQLIGTIHTYEDLLRQSVTPTEQLQALDLVQLQQLAQQLKERLIR